MKKILIICLSYFFITISVYLTSNYMFKIIQKYTSIDKNEYAKLNMLVILKCLGAFFWSFLAERTKKYKLIICTCLLGFAFFLNMYRFAPSFCKPNKLNFFTYFYKSSYLFFLSGIFPLMDFLTLEYLELIGGEKKWFKKVKISMCLGILVSHLLVMFISKEFIEKSSDLQLIATFLFAIMVSLFIYTNFGQIEKLITKKETKSKKKFLSKKDFKLIKSIFTLNFVLLLVSTVPQGIHRQVMISFLEEYFSEKNIDKPSGAKILAIRSCSELCVFFLTDKIENLVGQEKMFISGIFVSLIRLFLYAVIDFRKVSYKTTNLFFTSAECVKGVEYALFFYAVSRLVKKISTTNNRALAQGIYSGCFNGLAPFLSEYFGSILLKKSFVKLHGSSLNGFFFVLSVFGFIGFIFGIFFVYRVSKIKNYSY